MVLERETIGTEEDSVGRHEDRFSKINFILGGKKLDLKAMYSLIIWLIQIWRQMLMIEA